MKEKQVLGVEKDPGLNARSGHDQGMANMKFYSLTIGIQNHHIFGNVN